MSKKFSKSAIFSTALLAFGALNIAPSLVLANPAGGDSNASGTDPATNPTINWGVGGANGSIEASGSQATSLAGISWHTDPNTAVLSLLRVPNFDFGAWNFDGGPAGSGANNANWYPGAGTAGSAGMPGYNNGGITASASAMKFASLASNGTQLTSASPDRYNVSNTNRVAVVKDMRNGTGGWKLQLAVGSFDRDGSGDGTVTGTSPTGGATQLKGAALVVQTSKMSVKMEASNLLVGAKPPELASNSGVILYSADRRASGVPTGGNTSNAQGYDYGSPVTIISANQSSNGGDRGNGQGTWIGDFTDKDSVLFTSPTEGLGTYTASLRWTLSSGPS